MGGVGPTVADLVDRLNREPAGTHALARVDLAAGRLCLNAIPVFEIPASWAGVTTTDALFGLRGVMARRGWMFDEPEWHCEPDSDGARWHVRVIKVNGPYGTWGEFIIISIR